MRKIVTILCFLLSISLCADPERIDVYFLSRPDAAINLYITNPVFKGLFAQSNFEDDCVPMGDGCFHPQLGYIEDDGSAKKEKKPIESPNKQDNVELKTINSEEVNLINCDDEYYFDLYCGKAKKIDKKPESSVELWIDTSSSMRLVDYSSDDAYCDRRRLVANLKSSCKKEMGISVFNTSKKRLSTLDNLCINHGTNDGDRVVNWLKESKAKHVIIITDMEEYIGGFREYLDGAGAEIHGIGVKPFLSTQLIDSQSEFLEFCK